MQLEHEPQFHDEPACMKHSRSMTTTTQFAATQTVSMSSSLATTTISEIGTTHGQRASHMNGSTNVFVSLSVDEDAEINDFLADDIEQKQLPDTDFNDENAETTKHLSMDQQLDMLRGKLSRRNEIIEVIRKAYYHDIIIVKEELRHARLTGYHRDGNSNALLSEDRLSSVPSVDLRDVLPLFAPAETCLRVHPCERCGGHLELVHGESKELMAARQEMARATKGEQQMQNIMQRMHLEAKEREELNEALQQRVKALTKENAYTLEQLQATRKIERDQKTMIANLHAKLQLAQATQEELDRLNVERKDIMQQLIYSNHDRDIFSASNNHLKEELAEVTKTLHHIKVEKAQLESDFGSNYYRLQEEIKKSKLLSEDLRLHQTQLAEKTSLSQDLQHSLTLLKEEFATALQRFEQTKRHLEDQLIEEERAREEIQEQNLEIRKANKKLVKDLEQMEKQSTGGSSQSTSHNEKSAHSANGSIAMSATEINGIVRKRIETLKCDLEWANMRENDLLGQLNRYVTATVRAGKAEPKAMKRQLSRMPSTTIITRFAPPSPQETAESTQGARQQSGSVRDGSLNVHVTATSSDPGKVGLGIQGSDGEYGLFDVDNKSFETYHQEIHRMVAEIEEGKDQIAKQQTTIADMERKHQALIDRLEESKLTIETLTGSVNALKMRLNQDSAGAAEQLEDMVRQIEDKKRDQQFEAEKTHVLMDLVKVVSTAMATISNNDAFLLEIDPCNLPQEDDNHLEDGDSFLALEMLRRKQDLRRKVLMDKAKRKFVQLCHSRSDLITLEITRLKEHTEQMQEDLDEAEHKIDSDQLQIRTLDAELAKLRLTVEMGKNGLTRSEKALRIATEELAKYQDRCSAQVAELSDLHSLYAKQQEAEKRLTMMLFEKTKAWEKEMNANEKCNQKLTSLEENMLQITADRDRLLSKLQDIESLAELRRRTNQSVEVSATPETVDAEMQTDRWQPQGLILRQRNGPDKMPQRYLGKASVMIACPELSKPPSSSPMIGFNQESMAGFTPRATMSSSQNSVPLDSDEQMRDFLELNIYPSAKAGGRQIKTSYAGSRPKALSRLYLSSDGISQKYIAPSPREAFRDPPLLDGLHQVRPFTSH